jgi:predicted NBD/HSP70 family sugar kinase
MATRSTGRTDVTRSAILARLGAQGPASRADLARALDVSPALITQLVKELIADGLVDEREHSPSQGGRPARRLGLVSTAGHAVGLKIAPDHLAFVEVELDGTVIRSAQEPFDASSATLLEGLGNAVEGFISGGSGVPILGIGVAIPGTVDAQGSEIVDSYQLDWNDMPIGPTLRRMLGLPVLVENNVNALAMAERLFGIGRNHATFLTLTIGTGVGAGLVMDGVVLRGGSGGAGEIGHVPVIAGGFLCSCGNHGCLETVVGQAALERRAREAGIIPSRAGIAALTRAADDGDARAQAIFSEAGQVLARVLASVVQVFDPESVIVLGEGAAAWKHWAAGFEPEFRAALLPDRRGVPVEIEAWTDESWAQGAAALVLSTPFDAVGLAGEQGRLVRSRLSVVPKAAASKAGGERHGR